MHADTASRDLQQDLPHLALLDIQISGDIDGVDLAEIIRDQFDSFYFLPRPMRTMKPCFVLGTRSIGYLVKPYEQKVNAAIQITKASLLTTENCRRQL
jgi:two-component SAPR family response regulator